MKTPSEVSNRSNAAPNAHPSFRAGSWFSGWGRDLVKLGFALGALVGMCALFFSTPTLATPTLAAFFIALMLSPLVAQLERAGMSRTTSVILVLFTVLGILGIAGYLSYSLVENEWDSFKEKGPIYFARSLDKVRVLEETLHQKSALFKNVQLSSKLEHWMESSEQWFVNHGAALAGNLLSSLLLAPLIVFFLLNDGRSFRKVLFQLIPNRIFESAYIVTHKIAAGISDYIRAKLIEALIVGTITWLGLWLVGAPYSVVLGVIAGVCNIIPYAGPVLGALPGLILLAFDPECARLIFPVSLVYLIANLVDFLLIFPVFVAKLVDLHPVFLLAAVAIGQEYYGLVGMLISIPIASAFKVISQELYYAVYSRGVRRAMSYAPADGPSGGLVGVPIPGNPHRHSGGPREPFNL